MTTLSDLLDLDDTLGAAFIGFAVSCVVLGVSTNQVVTYFSRYPQDRIPYKLLVVLLWILEITDQVFIGHSLYFYLIKNYANPAVMLEEVIWSLILQIIIGVIIGTIVRLCFAMRVWRFSHRNLAVTSLIVALTLSELGLSIVYTARSFQNPYFATLPNLKVIASLSLGAGVLTDVVIAFALCYFLRKLRTGHKRSDGLVTRLTVYAVNTGAITAAVAVCTLVLYDVRPSSMQFMAFYFVLCKLYAISFLCTLNTRRIVRGKGTDRSRDRTDDAPLSGRSDRRRTANSAYTPHAGGLSYPFSSAGGMSGSHRRRDYDVDVDDEQTNIFHLGTRIPQTGTIMTVHEDPETDFDSYAVEVGYKSKNRMQRKVQDEELELELESPSTPTRISPSRDYVVDSPSSGVGSGPTTPVEGQAVTLYPSAIRTPTPAHMRTYPQAF
ncbi:hypothetical protein C8F01DRAFT_1255522 [Mycena amicta]|nr:hypothetical protein C8F01DRAFT_1255522 [Mycena amicta]